MKSLKGNTIKTIHCGSCIGKPYKSDGGWRQEVLLTLEGGDTVKSAEWRGRKKDLGQQNIDEWLSLPHYAIFKPNGHLDQIVLRWI